MRSRLNQQVGYLLNDNRCSGGKKEEYDVVVCGHKCGGQVMLKKDWEEDGGYCGHCEHPVCGPCADKIDTQGCKRFVDILEAKLNDQYRRQQNARVLGI